MDRNYIIYNVTMLNPYLAFGVWRLWQRMYATRTGYRKGQDEELQRLREENSQLGFVVVRMSHKMGHLARRFLPTVVRVLKFRAADVCANDREKHRKEGFVHAF